MDFSTILLSVIDIKDFFTGSFCGNHQSESTFIDHETFNKFYVNQSKLKSTSHEFFSNFYIKYSEFNIFLVTLFVR